MVSRFILFLKVVHTGGGKRPEAEVSGLGEGRAVAAEVGDTTQASSKGFQGSIPAPLGYQASVVLDF